MWTQTRVWIEQFTVLRWPVVIELAFDATVVLAAALLVCICLRRTSAATRHRVWALAVVSLLALPLIRLSAPTAPLVLWPAPRSETSGESSEVTDVPASATRTHSPRTDVLATDAAVPDASEDVFVDNPAITLPEHPSALPGSTPAEAPVDRPTPGLGDNTGQGEIGAGSVALPWRAMLVASWGLGVVVMLASFAVSIARGWHLVKSAEPVIDPSWHLLPGEVALRLGLRRRVGIVTSRRAMVPLTAGWLRPTIVLPAESDRWSQQRRRAVLVHELSHVIRHDVLWQMVARWACAVYWFHPLVWLAARRLRIERETACDDAVLLSGEQASSYASHLLELASAIAGRPRQPRTAVAMATSSMERRIRSILRPGVRRGPVGRATGGLLVGGTAVVLAVVAAVSPAAAPPRALAVSPEPASPKAEPPDENEPADTAASPEARQMTVRIVDEAGRPIVGARLSATAARERTISHSDSNGMAQVPLLEEDPGYFVIRALVDGYVPVAARWENAKQLDPIPSEFTLRLPKGTTIGGIVRDQQGRPIGRADVLLRLPSDTVWGGRATLGVWGLVATTDAQGRWRSDQMPSALGNLEIKLRHPDHLSDTSNRTQIPTIDQFRDQSGVMVMQEGHDVTGTVTDADGNPLASAVVCVGRSLSGSEPRTTKTDQQGRFRFEHVGQRATFLWAFSAGWAPRRVDLAVGPGSEPVQVRLERGRIVRLRVVDEKDQPLADASVYVSGWLPHHVAVEFGLDTRTDREGRWAWDWAPNADLKLAVHKQRHAHASATVPPQRQQEMVVKLLPVLRVSGRVTDAQTGKPIDEFVAAEGILLPLPLRHSTHWSPRWTFRNPEGRYRLVFGNASALGHRIRIEAEGYAPQQSRIFRDEERKVSLDIKLTKSTGPQGVVRLPDGKPAAGAEVFLYSKGNRIYVRNGKPDSRGNLDCVRTGPAGKFSLGAQIGLYRIFVFHPQGFGEVSQKQLQDSLEITLQPWARLEGTLRIGSRPAADHIVSLHYDPPDRRRGQQQRWGYLDYQTKTDAEGRFVFEHCLPGGGSVHRMYLASSTPGGWTYGVTHNTPVELTCGKTATVSVGGFGRPVVGRVVMPEGDDREVDWAKHSIGATRPKSEYPFPPGLKDPPAEFKDLDAKGRQERLNKMGDTPERRALAEKWNDWGRRQTAWLNEWRRSKEGKAFRARFSGKLDSEGRFRIEDVPAGSFELNMTVFPPGGSERHSWDERIGDVKHQFTVPEMPGGRSHESLDLGEIEVILAGQLKPGDRAPGFQLKTLSGKPLRLSALRGKYVVLAFWRGPENSPLAWIQYLKVLHRQFAKHPKFAFVGLSLAVDLDAQRQYMQKQEIPWTQGLLDPESKVISDYDLGVMPHLLLIGPDGTVLRRGIDPVELGRELEKLLVEPD
jgi:beta-lactamase regulating signal transducer with metallopeptidase domain/peroxiredoxin